MIQFYRNSSSTRDLRIKIVGLGGAGGNMLDRLILDGAEDVELVAINTDAQTLTASVVAEKVQLGRTTTRGLGAGGDPEVGYSAAEEGTDEIRRALDGAQMVFLCVGLGGGTGSGAARIVASIAREQNALVVVFATLPFSFEGKRRRAQAEEALGALQRYADVVIHFENDRMGDAVAPLAGIQEAFSMADQTLGQSIRAIATLVRRRGLIHVGFDEIATALRGSTDGGAHCLFGFGEADGDNRAHEALARALKNPLMDRGRMLENARNVMVNVAGGPGMTLNEVQILMEELNRHISDQTRLLFGATVDPTLGHRMSVTILSALAAEGTLPLESRPRPAARAESVPVSAPVRELSPEPVRAPEPVHAAEPVYTPEPDPIPEPAAEPEPVYAPVAATRDYSSYSSYHRAPEPEVEPEPPVRRYVAPAPAPEPIVPVEQAIPPAPVEPEPEPARVAATAAAAKAAKSKAVLAKQEQMQFEPVTRGRFEKSEPTIVDGQDLDVPTFLRRNVKVK